jgi:hypothetical protein
LTSLAGLENLTTASLIWIDSNEELTSVDALQGLDPMSASTSIGFTSTKLTNVDGLRRLKTLESLELLDNPLLTNFDGLQCRGSDCVVIARC